MSSGVFSEPKVSMNAAAAKSLSRSASAGVARRMSIGRL
jgi:hypothetical protein